MGLLFVVFVLHALVPQVNLAVQKALPFLFTSGIGIVCHGGILRKEGHLAFDSSHELARPWTFCFVLFVQIHCQEHA